VKFLFKLVTFSKSYARKQKWVFFSEHSVNMATCHVGLSYVMQFMYICIYYLLIYSYISSYTA